MMKILELYREAAVSSGRHFFSLLFEAMLLRSSSRQLGLTEYIDFQLYKKDLPWGEKFAFGGHRAQAGVEELLIDDYSKFLSLDKITMYAVLSRFDFPIPEIVATYRSARPSFHRQFHSKDEFSEFLQSRNDSPVYLKRAFGSYGRGNALIEAVRRGEVLLGSGSSEPLDDFIDSLDDGHSLGWILQDPLTSHSDIAELTGSSKVSGMRIHSFMGKGRSKILKAIFKLNAGVRDSDNFEHGASGNMLAAVDIQTGQIIRAISGVGLQQQEIPLHPRTQAKLTGFQIPHWKKTVELVLDAHKAFPGFICPGWDIAICESGPRILEVNAFGDIDLSQHAYRSSFFDERFLSSLQDRELLHMLDRKRGTKKRSPENNRIGIKRHHWSW